MSTPDPQETGVEVAPSDENVYTEDENFTPDPTMVTGTLDTSGTAGAEDSKVENTTPVFDAADSQNVLAAEASVHGEGDAKVVLPGEDDRTPEQAVEIIEKKAEGVRENPTKVVDPTVQNQEKNAEKVEGENRAQTAQRVQGEQQGAAPTGGNSVDMTDNSGAAVAQQAEKDSGGSKGKTSGKK